MYKFILSVMLVALVGCVPAVESNVTDKSSLNTDAKRDAKPGTSPQANPHSQELKRVQEELKKAKEKETQLNAQIEKQKEELQELNTVISSGKDKLKTVLESFESIGNKSASAKPEPGK